MAKKSAGNHFQSHGQSAVYIYSSLPLWPAHSINLIFFLHLPVSLSRCVCILSICHMRLYRWCDIRHNDVGEISSSCLCANVEYLRSCLCANVWSNLFQVPVVCSVHATVPVVCYAIAYVYRLYANQFAQFRFLNFSCLTLNSVFRSS